MSKSKATVSADRQLEIITGSPEISISNLGSSNAIYSFTQAYKLASQNTVSQTLSGTAAMQTYENVVYPIVISNTGDQDILVQ